MKFQILSRWDVEGMDPPEEPHVFFSITDPEAEDAKINKGENCKGIFRFKFHDVDDKYPSDKVWPITDEQAKCIAKYFKDIKNDVKLIIIHCEAGISRSAGIGAAFMKFLWNDDTQVFDNCNFCPNRLVYRKVLTELMTNEQENRSG